MPRRASSKSPVSASESAANSTTVFPMIPLMRFLSPLPTARAMLTVVPMASPTTITVIMCITCEPTETAVIEAAPSNWPMI